VKLKIKICNHCGDFVPIDRPTCLDCSKNDMNIFELNAVLTEEIRPE